MAFCDLTHQQRLLCCSSHMVYPQSRLQTASTTLPLPSSSGRTRGIVIMTIQLDAIMHRISKKRTQQRSLLLPQSSIPAPQQTSPMQQSQCASQHQSSVLPHLMLPPPLLPPQQLNSHNDADVDEDLDDESDNEPEVDDSGPQDAEVIDNEDDNENTEDDETDEDQEEQPEPSKQVFTQEEDDDNYVVKHRHKHRQTSRTKKLSPTKVTAPPLHSHTRVRPRNNVSEQALVQHQQLQQLSNLQNLLPPFTHTGAPKMATTPPKISTTPPKATSPRASSTLMQRPTQAQLPQATRTLLTAPGTPTQNSGKDNESNDLILHSTDVLGSSMEPGEAGRCCKIKNSKYTVLEMLGQGTFGQVVRCLVHPPASGGNRNNTSESNGMNAIVAIKVLKNKPAYFRQGMLEVGILAMLNNQYDPKGDHKTVRMTDYFIFCNHLCIVFELLSINLFELVKQNGFRGLSARLIRLFTSQVLDALEVMDEANIIHCDLKPENILMESAGKAKVKLIDFGSACFGCTPLYTYIQSRHYRAPEVLLGVGYTCAIDMWSLGCIAAELLIGIPLFPGANEYNQVQKIVDMQGNFPNEMLERGNRTTKFFRRVYSNETQSIKFVMKSMAEYEHDNQVKLEPDKKYFVYRTLSELIQKSSIKLAGTTWTEIEVKRSFEHFLQGLLQLDPKKRWTASQAKAHPFINEQPLPDNWVPPPIIDRSQKNKESESFYVSVVSMMQSARSQNFSSVAYFGTFVNLLNNHLNSLAQMHLFYQPKAESTSPQHRPRSKSESTTPVPPLRTGSRTQTLHAPDSKRAAKTNPASPRGTSQLFSPKYSPNLVPQAQSKAPPLQLSPRFLPNLPPPQVSQQTTAPIKMHSPRNNYTTPVKKYADEEAGGMESMFSPLDSIPGTTPPSSSTIPIQLKSSGNPMQYPPSAYFPPNNSWINTPHVGPQRQPAQSTGFAPTGNTTPRSPRSPRSVVNSTACSSTSMGMGIPEDSSMLFSPALHSTSSYVTGSVPSLLSLPPDGTQPSGLSLQLRSTGHQQYPQQPQQPQQQPLQHNFLQQQPFPQSGVSGDPSVIQWQPNHMPNSAGPLLSMCNPNVANNGINSGNTQMPVLGTSASAFNYGSMHIHIPHHNHHTGGGGGIQPGATAPLYQQPPQPTGTSNTIPAINHQYQQQQQQHQHYGGWS